MKTRVVEPDITVVEISGRLDLGNSLSYTETSVKKMIEDGSRKMVLALTELNFIDSAGVGMLISCGGQMERAGGAIRIAGAHGTVAKTLEVIHMSRIVRLDEDVEDACRALAPGG